MRKLFFHMCIQISLLSTFLYHEWIESKRKFRRIAKSFHRKLFPQKLWTLRSYINILFFPLFSRRDAVWSCACNSSNNQSTSESSSNKKVDFENLALKLEFSRGRKRDYEHYAPIIFSSFPYLSNEFNQITKEINRKQKSIESFVFFSSEKRRERSKDWKRKRCCTSGTRAGRLQCWRKKLGKRIRPCSPVYDAGASVAARRCTAYETGHTTRY